MNDKSPLEKARAAPRRKYGQALREKAKKGSRAAAIRLFCLECMGGSTSEVLRCTSPDCALYPYRTGRFIKNDGESSS
jgi:hypothetical protein